MKSVYIDRIIHTYTGMDIFTGTNAYFFSGITAGRKTRVEGRTLSNSFV